MNLNPQILAEELLKAADHYGMAGSSPCHGAPLAPIDPTAARVLKAIAYAIQYATAEDRQ